MGLLNKGWDETVGGKTDQSRKLDDELFLQFRVRMIFPIKTAELWVKRKETSIPRR